MRGFHYVVLSSDGVYCDMQGRKTEVGREMVKAGHRLVVYWPPEFAVTLLKKLATKRQEWRLTLLMEQYGRRIRVI